MAGDSGETTGGHLLTRSPQHVLKNGKIRTVPDNQINNSSNNSKSDNHLQLGNSSHSSNNIAPENNPLSNSNSQPNNNSQSAVQPMSTEQKIESLGRQISALASIVRELATERSPRHNSDNNNRTNDNSPSPLSHRNESNNLNERSPIHNTTHQNTIRDSRDSVYNAAYSLQEAPVNFRDNSDFKFHPFMKQNPQEWFDMLEQRFTARNITDDRDKYYNVIKNLPPDVLNKVEHLLKSLPAGKKYSKIKGSLINKFSEKEDSRLTSFLSNTKMGTYSPTEFLEFLTAKGNEFFPRQIILKIWLEGLPTSISVLLDPEITESSETKMLQKAEKIYQKFKVECPSSINMISEINSNSSEYKIVPNKLDNLGNKLDRICNSIAGISQSKQSGKAYLSSRDQSYDRKRSRSSNQNTRDKFIYRSRDHSRDYHNGPRDDSRDRYRPRDDSRDRYRPRGNYRDDSRERYGRPRNEFREDGRDRYKPRDNFLSRNRDISLERSQHVSRPRERERIRNTSRSREKSQDKDRNSSRSSSREKSIPARPYCWYHVEFGNKADQCTPPCSWNFQNVSNPGRSRSRSATPGRPKNWTHPS